jgi:hypothetical protein
MRLIGLFIPFLFLRYVNAVRARAISLLHVRGGVSKSKHPDVDAS